MKANAKSIGVACALALSCSLALAQLGSTNTASSPQPSPIVHNASQSHDAATNAIIDPSGALATNRVPEMTNTPTPLAPAGQTPPPN